MDHPPHHTHEPTSNTQRDLVAKLEPRSLRTYTPTQAVLAKSAGIYHWTPEGRRLYDFTSGVLVANLGHNPHQWMRHFLAHMGWQDEARNAERGTRNGEEGDAQFFAALPMTA